MSSRSTSRGSVSFSLRNASSSSKGKASSGSRRAPGGGGRGGGGGRPGGGGNVPTLFFSRRIGLEDGEVVPVIGGGRITGKVGAFDVGALSIQTDELASVGIESTNFTVMRLKRDILRRSSVGAIFTSRSVSLVGNGASQTYGIDAAFGFHDDVEVVGYVAKTRTPSVTEHDTSYYGRFGYRGDRYSFTSSHLLIGENFNPEVGFVRRDDVRRTLVRAGFSPRPRSIESIRQFRLEGRVEYLLTAHTDVLESRLAAVEFRTEFENSDRLTAQVRHSHELLEAPFEIATGIVLPVGDYDFTDVRMSYMFGEQRPVSGSFSIRAGRFWSGDIKAVEFTRGRVEVLPQLSVEPSIAVNWVTLPEGSFRTDLGRARFNYSFSPRMFFSGLVQYNSSGESLSSNLRLRWEYTPGSELFVVYTDDRNTDPLSPVRSTELRNRGFVVKITRLFRF